MIVERREGAGPNIARRPFFCSLNGRRAFRSPPPLPYLGAGPKGGIKLPRQRHVVNQFAKGVRLATQAAFHQFESELRGPLPNMLQAGEAGPKRHLPSADRPP